MMKNSIVTFCLSLFLLLGLRVVMGAPSLAAPLSEGLRAKAVQGVLPGSQFAQIWLRLEPEVMDAPITVFAEWDRLFPAANGLNFFIFDEQQLRRLGEENDSFSALALAAGNPHFELSMPDNVMGAGFKATGLAVYTLVIVNESLQDARFILRTTNAYILDDAGQVTVFDPSALPMQNITTTATETIAEVAPVQSIPIDVTPTPLPITGMLDLSAPTVTQSIAPTASQPISFTPIPRIGVKRDAAGQGISGLLLDADTEQVIYVQSNKTAGQILLRLAMPERADTLRIGKNQLNFWVFNEVTFGYYQAEANPRRLAITAGKAVFRSVTDERVAGFRGIPMQRYVVVIYSTLPHPISYTLSIEGATVLSSAYLP